MVMSRSTAVGAIVTGCIILGFTLITVICGAISMSTFSGPIVASAGLWSLYFAVPGILTIVAGAGKSGVVMGFALFFNILAVLLSLGATVVLIFFVMLFDKIGLGQCTTFGGYCHCPYQEGIGWAKYNYSSWNLTCDELDTIRSILIACLVVYIILTIATFAASIFGCLGTCCTPTEPVFVVAAATPMQTVGTVVVSSNQTSPAQPGYSGSMPPPYYSYGQPQAYENKSGIVD